MRQLKFKYINVKHKSIFSEIFTLKQIELGEAQTWCERSLVHKDTLYKLQFTGFTGKNDKEIYEDDILLNSHGIKCVVTFKDGGFIAEGKGFFIVPSYFWNVKLIGNIHQNKELLK